jgi:hypothetical protein
VVSDRRCVSFIYSYSNLIPLPAKTVRKIVGPLASYSYDRIYGGWWDRNVEKDAQAAAARSAERYIAAIRETT